VLEDDTMRGLVASCWRRLTGGAAGLAPPARAQSELARLALQPGERLLVLGLGRRPSPRALPAAVRATLVDPREERVSAWRLSPPPGVFAGDLFAMALDDLDFASGRFDSAVINVVLAGEADRGIVREAARVIRPGGRLLACTRAILGGLLMLRGWRRLYEAPAPDAASLRVVLLTRDE
jgi:hypothetical protein